jgi:hypothetical protein
MSDRLVFILLYRLAPSILNAVTIVRPETIVRWHRAGFRSFWRWKSRRHAGRPSVAPEIRRLIREMSLANPLWGALTGRQMWSDHFAMIFRAHYPKPGNKSGPSAK